MNYDRTPRRRRTRATGTRPTAPSTHTSRRHDDDGRRRRSRRTTTSAARARSRGSTACCTTSSIRQTRARHVHLAVPDRNNYFCALYRTPPDDSTGVPHIMEHCVSGGSRRFPPGAGGDMYTRSLLTDINGMTRADHTTFYVATRNHARLHELARVHRRRHAVPADGAGHVPAPARSLRVHDAGRPHVRACASPGRSTTR